MKAQNPVAKALSPTCVVNYRPSSGTLTVMEEHQELAGDNGGMVLSPARSIWLRQNEVKELQDFLNVQLSEASRENVPVENERKLHAVKLLESMISTSYATPTASAEEWVDLRSDLRQLHELLSPILLPGGAQ